MNLTGEELARYSRHLSLSEFGVGGQHKLKAARVLVVGAGGLGSPALLYLAAAGIGRIGIVDFDRIDISNLQRQVLFDTGMLGHGKAESARIRLQALNPHVQVRVHADELCAANVLGIISDYDMVLDGTDRFATRYLLNDACVILGKPLVSAAIHRFEGQAFTYVPQHSPCYRCLFPQPPAEGAVPNCAEAGVLGVLPGVMGTIQATEAIKLITGIGAPLTGRLLTYDALEMRFDEFKFAARADCAVCGRQPSITVPQDFTVVCTSPTPYQNMSAAQLQTLLHAHPLGLMLVDVREPEEFAAGHLPHSLNIPVNELAVRLNELIAAQSLVFMCRGGGRSVKACTLASEALPDAAGRQLFNLHGGLLSWHQHVDHALIVI
jgi:sulfur-carrier protein adenylyltransferase/sulfurtransferase